RLIRVSEAPLVRGASSSLRRTYGRYVSLASFSTGTLARRARPATHAGVRPAVHHQAPRRRGGPVAGRPSSGPGHGNRRTARRNAAEHGQPSSGGSSRAKLRGSHTL